jgi:hypothetical protein
VKSSGYNAEYRAATGGVVSVLTKTGSNDWHGSAGTYFDTLRLRGALRQTLRLNPSDQTIAENVKTKSADYTDWEPVFELGGPVIRDRIWFYAGGVTEVMPSERTVRFAQNGTTGTFKSTDKQYVANYNVTGQITNKLRTRVSALDRRDKNGPALPAIEPDGLTSNARRRISQPDSHGQLQRPDHDFDGLRARRRSTSTSPADAELTGRAGSAREPSSAIPSPAPTRRRRSFRIFRRHCDN